MIDRLIAEIDAAHVAHEGDVHPFEYQDPFGVQAWGFVIRWRGALRAYRNLCPHWAMRLDAGDHALLDPDEGRWIMCQLHGALFDPEDGRCHEGPPRGDRLEAFTVQWAEGQGTVRILRGQGLSL